ncbi:hypothetical protein [Halobacillus campisalis]|uniref:Uncharacterized protein n=1 Tax=Halobacillus campisalis TaxID=435909 RepID=A0ABW2K7P4_9BACI|nr:hypothetical protein [Halobacillus campisalis]
MIEDNAALKEKNKKLRADLQKLLEAEKPIVANTDGDELLYQLEKQVKELLGQSFDYEEEMDSKLVIMTALESKMEELNAEIEEIENEVKKEE